MLLSSFLEISAHVFGCVENGALLIKLKMYTICLKIMSIKIMKKIVHYGSPWIYLPIPRAKSNVIVFITDQ